MNMPELKISAKPLDIARATLSFQGVAVSVAWNNIKDFLAGGEAAANDERDYTPEPYRPSYAPRPYRPEASTQSMEKENTAGASLYQLLDIYGNRAQAIEITAAGRDLLDAAFPLAGASHRDAATYLIYFQHLLVILENGESCGLENPAQLIGFNGSAYEPESIQLRNGELQIELQLCKHGARGSADPANIEDIVIESALDAVIDCLQPHQQTTTAETKQVATPSNSSEYQSDYRHTYQQGAVAG